MFANLLHMRLLIAAGAMAVAVAFPDQHAEAAGATAGAGATVVTPISIGTNADLSFGKFSNNGLAGTVTVSTTGSTAASNGLALVTGSGASAAQFTVAGQADLTYTVTLPTSITVTSGANSMTIDNFTSSISTTGTLTSGFRSFTVGVRLNVGAGQPVGTYTGTFAVAVEYN